MDAVDRHALRLVHGRGVAVIHVTIILHVESDRSTVIEHHRHPGLRDRLHLPERAILHAKAALVLQEHDAVTGCELPLAALGAHGNIVAQRTARTQPLARREVERADLVIGVGEDDPRGAWRDAAISIPAIDQLAPRLIAGFGSVDAPALVVRSDCLGRSPGSELSGRIALPVVALAADLSDLDAAVALSGRAECPAGLDRLELLGVADQDDLRAALLGLADDTLHLT